MAIGSHIRNMSMKELQLKDAKLLAADKSDNASTKHEGQGARQGPAE
ncbi:MAG: hypothetical protein J0I75_08250 [Hyphomicrobium sp.]|nr:hypothetical protein [Hyphomicrobium sp.]